MKFIKRGSKGLTIEYVLILLVLVAAMIVAIVTVTAVSSKHVSDYRYYVEEKMLLDEIGSAFISKKVNRESVDLDEKFGDRAQEYHIAWTESGSSLTVRNDFTREVLLYVELATVDGQLQPVIYRYGLF